MFDQLRQCFSLCADYATEKLFVALNADVVPVVLGGMNYTHILPASAVIDVEDFSSPSDLANYLKYLIKNQTAYEQHLQWKYSGQKIWKIPGTSGFPNSRWCKLCEILHRPPDGRIQKTYPHILEWFQRDQCRSLKASFV